VGLDYNAGGENSAPALVQESVLVAAFPLEKKAAEGNL